jgi:hypothetical protein
MAAVAIVQAIVTIATDMAARTTTVLGMVQATTAPVAVVHGEGSNRVAQQVHLSGFMSAQNVLVPAVVVVVTAALALVTYVKITPSTGDANLNFNLFLTEGVLHGKFSR